MVFFDVEKAFDSVWHEGLLHKLVIPNFYLYISHEIIASFSAAVSFTSLSIKPITLHSHFVKVFQKVPYCLLPYTISSQPAGPRATRVKLPYLWMILQYLCPADILGWCAIYCNDTSIFFPCTTGTGR
jgi:hypothetical protein